MAYSKLELDMKAIGVAHKRPPPHGQSPLQSHGSMASSVQRFGDVIRFGPTEPLLPGAGVLIAVADA